MSVRSSGAVSVTNDRWNKCPCCNVSNSQLAPSGWEVGNERKMPKREAVGEKKVCWKLFGESECRSGYRPPMFYRGTCHGDHPVLFKLVRSRCDPGAKDTYLYRLTFLSPYYFNTDLSSLSFSLPYLPYPCRTSCAGPAKWAQRQWLGAGA